MMMIVQGHMVRCSGWPGCNVREAQTFLKFIWLDWRELDYDDGVRDGWLIARDLITISWWKLLLKRSSLTINAAQENKQLAVFFVTFNTGDFLIRLYNTFEKNETKGKWRN